MMIKMFLIIVTTMKIIWRSANQNTAVQGLIGSTNAYIGLSDTATEVDDEYDDDDDDDNYHDHANDDGKDYYPPTAPLTPMITIMILIQKTFLWTDGSTATTTIIIITIIIIKMITIAINDDQNVGNFSVDRREQCKQLFQLDQRPACHAG